MFILRKFAKEKPTHESNLCLGNCYTLVSKSLNPEEFKKTRKLLFDDDLFIMAIAFVTSEGGKDVMPIYPDDHAYIMMSDGKTFARIN